MRNLILCVITVFTSWHLATVIPWATGDENKDPFAWHWYEVDQEGTLRLNLYVFWRSTCPHCPLALEYVKRLGDRHDWLRVRRFEISQHRGNLELYRRMAQSLNRPAGQVPAFFFCQRMVLSFHSEQDGERRIERPLVHCYQYLHDQWQRQRRSTGPTMDSPGQTSLWQQGRVLAQIIPQDRDDELRAEPDQPVDSAIDLEALPPAGRDGSADALSLSGLKLPPPPEPAEEIVELPLVGPTDARELSLPLLTLVLAGCDAFNPCAFFVLLSLLSLLIHARNRWRIFTIGGIFVFFSGLFYFLFMAAWLNVFFLAGHLRWITILAGTLAVVIALINMKDYFYFHRGISLSIPEHAKSGLFERMRRLVDSAGMIPMLLGTLGLAVAANSYELLCTAGFPMVFTRVLTLHELPTAAYYGYLVGYNIIYVVPLAIIVVAFTVTLGRRKLSEMEGRILKLLSGAMMLCLGLIILLAPEWLQYVQTAVGILVAAVGLTAAIVGCDHWSRGRGRRTPARKAPENSSQPDHASV